MARRTDIDVLSKERSMGALIFGTRISGREVLLVKPLLYMNRSGIVVDRIVEAENIPLEKTLVVVDDVNLPFGQLRFRKKGQAGGHNGLSSVIAHLGTETFPRLRIGIDAPPGEASLTEFVLEELSREEEEALKPVLESAAEGILVWIEEGLDTAMNMYNERDR